MKLYSEAFILATSNDISLPYESSTKPQVSLIDIRKRLPLPENGEQIIENRRILEEEWKLIEQDNAENEEGVKEQLSQLESEVSELKRRRYRIIEELRKIDERLSEKELEIKEIKRRQEGRVKAYESRAHEISAYKEVNM